MNSKEHNVVTTANYFEKQFNIKPAGVWAAPGRANLIGEHTDYNEGFVFPFAINRTTHCAIALSDDDTIEVASLFNNGSIKTAKINTNLNKSEIEDWSSYPLGVLWALKEAGYEIPGMRIFLTTDVPIGSGLSSSAAIECSVALAVRDLLNLDISRKLLATYCQKAENEVAGAPTGIMDQSASLLGKKDYALYLDCRSLDTDLVPLNLDKTQVSILVVDTQVKHALADGQGYTQRKNSCDKAAKILGVPSLRDIDVTELPEAKEKLDEETYKRLHHIVTENERVLKTIKTLEDGTIEDIGKLLNESHVSMRDDFEISCPELDLAVKTAQDNGAIGARMTGGGFGGAALAVVKNSDIDKVSEAIKKAFEKASYKAPNIFTVTAGEGAHKLNSVSKTTL
ncbi:MAG: galactokinase [Micrococcaceae bacterium]